MLKGAMGKELVIKTLNEIGVLAGIARTVAEKGIGILAFSAWVEGENGIIHLVTDDNLRAGDALRRKNYDVRESGVVMVEMPNKPGLLKHVAERLGDEGIDVHHLFASATLNQATCLVVFSSSDNNRAVVAMNKEAGVAAR